MFFRRRGGAKVLKKENPKSIPYSNSIYVVIASKERAVIPRCREIRPEKYEVQAEKKSSSALHLY